MSYLFIACIVNRIIRYSLNLTRKFNFFYEIYVYDLVYCNVCFRFYFTCSNKNALCPGYKGSLSYILFMCEYVKINVTNLGFNQKLKAFRPTINS